MAMSRAAVRSWVEGFEAAREAERAATQTRRHTNSATIAVQLSDAALAARAPEIRRRRDAEDERVRDVWCRLKRHHRP